MSVVVEITGNRKLAFGAGMVMDGRCRGCRNIVSGI